MIGLSYCGILFYKILIRVKKSVKITTHLIENIDQNGDWQLSDNKITCESIDKDGKNVLWLNIETGKQYKLIKTLGRYFIYEI